MDISKLPKLSKTPADSPQPPAPASEDAADAPPDAEPPAASQKRRVPDYSGDPRGDAMPGEMWFNLIVGVIFLLLGQRFGAFAFTKLTHQPYHTHINWTAGPKSGQEVEYLELEGKPYLNESAMFIFGLAIFADTALCYAIFRRSKAKQGLVIAALVITGAATAYNLYVAGVLQSMGVLPLISLLAVAFGGYMAFQQWSILKAIRSARTS